MKKILGVVWRLDFKAEEATIQRISTGLDITADELELHLSRLVENGLLEKKNKEFNLTKKGRERIRVVACGGVFDILHPGHAFILEQAKSLGDVLIVIVARDSTVEKRKRIPIVPEEQRAEMVGHLRHVDMSILGNEGDPFTIIEEIRPDVIVLGPDQHHDEENIKSKLAERGLNVEVRRIEKYKECDLNSTKAILNRIIERNFPGSKKPLT